MTLFRDRYRVESTRLPGWDYASAGCYFVTICTRDRVCCLGDIVDGEMRLSAAGEMVADEWLKTARLRPNITLDEWVVMPNHFHGIVWIHDENSQTWPVGVETHCDASLQSVRSMNSFGPQRNNLSSVIRGFKGAATTRIHLANHLFAWQPRFHDRIIRDEKTLDAARAYIRVNPAQWAMDRDNPIHV